MVPVVVPSPTRSLPSIFFAHRVQQSHYSSIFNRVLLLTHALAFSASQFVGKEKSPRIYSSMHSETFELTKLTYARLEDNMIRHRGEGWLVTPLRTEVWLIPGSTGYYQSIFAQRVFLRFPKLFGLILCL